MQEREDFYAETEMENRISNRGGSRNKPIADPVVERSQNNQASGMYDMTIMPMARSLLGHAHPFEQGPQEGISQRVTCSDGNFRKTSIKQ